MLTWVQGVADVEPRRVLAGTEGDARAVVGVEDWLGLGLGLGVGVGFGYGLGLGVGVRVRG